MALLFTYRGSTLAVDSRGALVGWGRNDVGQLGLGSHGSDFLGKPDYPDFTERHQPWESHS